MNLAIVGRNGESVQAMIKNYFQDVIWEASGAKNEVAMLMQVLFQNVDFLSSGPVPDD